jgi:DNA polymerase elongation subunit (family B)
MSSPPRLIPEKDALVFQCIDIHTRDCIVFPERGSDCGSDSDMDSEPSRGSDGPPPQSFKDKQLELKHYQILLYGSDAHGRSVCLQVEDFRPYFYVRLPEGLPKEACQTLKSWIRDQAPSKIQDDVNIVEESHKTLLDYNGGFMARFLRVDVPSQALWRLLIKQFQTKQATSRIHKTDTLLGAAGVKFLKKALLEKTLGESVSYVSGDASRIGLKMYESNIDPVLRFFHERDIAPAGWIKVEGGVWDSMESSDAKTDIRAQCEWKCVNPAKDKKSLAPLTVASWDIECTSSHGDFPMAAKTWRKPVRELAEAREKCPATVEELCELLAAAIRGEQSPQHILSPVFLKKSNAAFGPNTLAETVRLVFVGKQTLSRVQASLTRLRNADTAKEREDAIFALDKLLTDSLPGLQGDPVIQIGTVLYRQNVPVSKHIWVYGTVDRNAVRPPGVEVPVHVYPFPDEKSMLKSWFTWIGTTDPDVMIGYNVFGFDERYVWDRLLELYGSEKALKSIVLPWSRLRSRPPRLEEKRLSSSAMGDNFMYILGSLGRLQIDLLPYIRRSYNLDSYTLDNVSATFVSGAVTSSLQETEPGSGCFRFGTKSTKGTVAGRYITLLDAENDRVVDRCEVIAVEPKALTVRIEGGAETLADHGVAPERWAQVKDDVSPKDIFRLHRGSAADRAIVARYCLQDCDLVMELFNKLDILNNSIAMANVCSVPVSFIFLRGQGIKIESLIFKECRAVDQLIEVMPSQAREGEEEVQEMGQDEEGEEDEANDTYEGAIVLEPHTGIYIDDPVTADDFASLYPSSIISENISHDTLIWVKDYDKEGNFVCIREGSEKYDNIPGAKYVNIEFDILRSDPADTRKHPAKIRDGKRIARYIQNPQGTIPRILEMLLASRKRCRKLAETEPDEFVRNLLDAQQLAYKLTANSLYGQLGSGTFKVRRQVLAASTTAYGRKQLMYAKAVIEAVYGGGRDPRCDVECVYGDTDSIFLRFRPKNPETGEKLHGKAALQAAKDLTVESGQLVSSCLKPPHDFEFDKIFRSFILLSKKRYVGDMSEDGVEDEDFHRKSMGIVMKRRDNAPIVKYVYGHAVDAILDPTRLNVKEGVQIAANFVQKASRDLLAGKFPMSKLTITKSLRADYADPTRIAHKVLADRIAERDPGNKPSTSDRIPFVFFENPKAKLSGDKIELPTYIKEHGLKPDYAHYITNQISKPVAQVFALALEYLTNISAAERNAAGKARDPVAAREKLAIKALFEPALADAARDPTAMEARGQKSIASFFGGK